MESSSPLLRLSPELRNLIYEYAVTEPSAVDLEAAPPPLTITCRQVRKETLLLYYSINTFNLRIPTHQCPVYVERFAASHFSTTPPGRAELASIRRLNIEYHLSSDENQPVPCQQANRGGWTKMAEVLAKAGMRRDQVVWTPASTGFDDASLGSNYFKYLAEAARLRLYRQSIVDDWERISDQFCPDAGKSSSKGPAVGPTSTAPNPAASDRARMNDKLAEAIVAHFSGTSSSE